MGNCLPFLSPSSYNNGSKVSPSPSSVLSGPTERLLDHYRLGEELGQGQFGLIRRCVHVKTGEAFACKSIAKGELQDLEEVRREIEILECLAGHPSVVQLERVFEDPTHVHLVMELCQGGELFDQIVKQKAYTEAEAALLTKRLIEVIEYCHRKGIMHRDLKPENILLSSHSPSSPIKLIDFGLALRFSKGEKCSGMAGSSYYIAPEVLEGDYSEEVDVWSAGVILYVLLSGVPPFWGETETQIFDAIQLAHLDFTEDPWRYISAPAQDLIRRMLSPEPEHRIKPHEILRHSWIVEHTGGQGKSTTKIGNIDQRGRGRRGIEAPLGYHESQAWTSFSSENSWDEEKKEESTSVLTNFSSSSSSCHSEEEEEEEEEEKEEEERQSSFDDEDDDVAITSAISQVDPTTPPLKNDDVEGMGCSYVVLTWRREKEILMVDSPKLGAKFLVVLDRKGKRLGWKTLTTTTTTTVAAIATANNNNNDNTSNTSITTGGDMCWFPCPAPSQHLIHLVF